MTYEQFERDSINSTLAREAYSRYLQGFQWDYFLTVTFRKPRYDSIKTHETMWSALTNYGVERAFLAVERHRYPNHSCHVHGLVKSSYRAESLYRIFDGFASILWRDFYRDFGRNRVEKIREVEQVAAYCSKYVVKRLSEYGFYGQPQFWQS